MNADGDIGQVKEIASAVSDVRSRIERFRKYVRGHETRTRVLLVDPVLCSLGWNVVEPDSVVIESHNETGKPDYVLRDRVAPRVVVEAKALGKLKVGKNIGQIATYIFQPSLTAAKVGVLTDGDSWYIRFKPHLDRPTVPRIRISDRNEEAHAIALNLPYPEVFQELL